MGRYPFMTAVNNYLPLIEGTIDPETHNVTRRNLKKISRIFIELKKKKAVSTDNPKKITAKDILAYVGYRKKQGKSQSTIHKELGILNKFLVMNDNDAITKFRIQYSSVCPRSYSGRLPPIDNEIVDRIFSNALKFDISQWKYIEAYALVSLSICSGMRPKELLMCYVNDVHFDEYGAYIHLIHVKGENSYARGGRTVPVLGEGIPILEKYFIARDLKLKSVSKTATALFPPINNDHEFYASNTLRRMKRLVEEDLGVTFQLRACRRTFGMRALESGHDIYNVSLAFGHQSVTTTQRFYADKKQLDAVEEMRHFSSKNNTSKKGEVQ